jgi:hypothetical protein
MITEELVFAPINFESPDTQRNDRTHQLRPLASQTPFRRHVSRCSVVPHRTSFAVIHKVTRPLALRHRAAHHAIIPFNLSFTSLSLGLFADDCNQSRTFPMATVCVTPGLLASTSIAVTGPGAQPCSRNTLTASATASYSVSACTFTECRMPSGSAKETVQVRTGTTELYHVRLVFAHRDKMFEL